MRLTTVLTGFAMFFALLTVVILPGIGTRCDAAVNANEAQSVSRRQEQPQAETGNQEDGASHLIEGKNVSTEIDQVESTLVELETDAKNVAGDVNGIRKSVALLETSLLREGASTRRRLISVMSDALSHTPGATRKKVALKVISMQADTILSQRATVKQLQKDVTSASKEILKLQAASDSLIDRCAKLESHIQGVVAVRLERTRISAERTKESLKALSDMLVENERDFIQHKYVSFWERIRKKAKELRGKLVEARESGNEEVVSLIAEDGALSRIEASIPVLHTMKTERDNLIQLPKQLKLQASRLQSFDQLEDNNEMAARLMATLKAQSRKDILFDTDYILTSKMALDEIEKVNLNAVVNAAFSSASVPEKIATTMGELIGQVMTLKLIVDSHNNEEPSELKLQNDLQELLNRLLEVGVASDGQDLTCGTMITTASQLKKYRLEISENIVRIWDRIHAVTGVADIQSRLELLDSASDVMSDYVMRPLVTSLNDSELRLVAMNTIVRFGAKARNTLLRILDSAADEFLKDVSLHALCSLGMDEVATLQGIVLNRTLTSRRRLIALHSIIELGIKARDSSKSKDVAHVIELLLEMRALYGHDARAGIEYLLIIDHGLATISVKPESTE